MMKNRRFIRVPREGAESFQLFGPVQPGAQPRPGFGHAGRSQCESNGSASARSSVHAVASSATAADTGRTIQRR